MKETFQPKKSTKSTVSIVTVEITFMVIFVIVIQLVRYTCIRHYIMINTVRDRCGPLFIMVLIQLGIYLALFVKLL